MTTQLRLVDPPESRPRPAAGAAKRATKQPSQGASRGSSRRARTTSVRTARRAASWGDWRLDAGTRRIGRAGVAQARQALEAAVETELHHGLRAS